MAFGIDPGDGGGSRTPSTPTDDNDSGGGGGGGGHDRDDDDNGSDTPWSTTPEDRPGENPGPDPTPDPNPTPANTSLTSVGTTRYRVNASGGQHSSPQLQAKVYNSGEVAADVTVRWFFGDVEVARTSKTVRGGGPKTVAKRVSYADVLDAVGPGDHRLRAKLSGDGTNGDERSNGTMHVETPPVDAPTSPGGLPAGFPTLPPIAGLTAEQTTLATLALVVLLVVA